MPKIAGLVLALSLVAVPAFAGERVCVGKAWRQLTPEQKQSFATEFKVNGGSGTPSDCQPSRLESAVKPQPDKAAKCTQDCTSDQVVLTSVCTLLVIVNPALAAGCSAVSPVYSPACQATCDAKYGVASKS